MAELTSDPASEGEQGPVALVTGASRGIGALLSRALLAHGWRVAAVSRSGDRPEGEEHPDLRCYRVDVTDEPAVVATVDAVTRDLGPVHLLVNNAGLIEPEVPLWESDSQTWWRVLTVNVRGPYLLTRAVVPGMIAAGGGRVVNLSSGAATAERADLTAYCASKSAVARITGGVALAGRPHGVLAFDLAPGHVRTDMTESMVLHRDRTEWTEPQDVVDLFLALAGGELDAFSGRMVRAGADDLQTLRRVAADGLPDGARMLRLRPWGDDDPLAR